LPDAEIGEWHGVLSVEGLPTGDGRQVPAALADGRYEIGCRCNTVIVYDLGEISRQFVAACDLTLTLSAEHDLLEMRLAMDEGGPVARSWDDAVELGWLTRVTCGEVE